MENSRQFLILDIALQMRCANYQGSEISESEKFSTSGDYSGSSRWLVSAPSIYCPSPAWFGLRWTFVQLLIILPCRADWGVNIHCTIYQRAQPFVAAALLRSVSTAACARAIALRLGRRTAARTQISLTRSEFWRLHVLRREAPFPRFRIIMLQRCERAG